jgi:hypothetical protein
MDQEVNGPKQFICSVEVIAGLESHMFAMVSNLADDFIAQTLRAWVSLQQKKFIVGQVERSVDRWIRCFLARNLLYQSPSRQRRLKSLSLVSPLISRRMHRIIDPAGLTPFGDCWIRISDEPEKN